MKVYLIMGETGSWDTYSIWPVAICSTPKKARDRIERLPKFPADHTDPCYLGGSCDHRIRYDFSPYVVDERRGK